MNDIIIYDSVGRVVVFSVDGWIGEKVISLLASATDCQQPKPLYTTYWHRASEDRE